MTSGKSLYLSVPAISQVSNDDTNLSLRVPSTAQWVEYPTAVAQIIAEVWVQSLALSIGLKEPVLPQLWLGFNSWPGNFHLLQVWP